MRNLRAEHVGALSWKVRQSCFLAILEDLARGGVCEAEARKARGLTEARAAANRTQGRTGGPSLRPPSRLTLSSTAMSPEAFRAAFMKVDQQLADFHDPPLVARNAMPPRSEMPTANISKIVFAHPLERQLSPLTLPGARVPRWWSTPSSPLAWRTIASPPPCLPPRASPGPWPAEPPSTSSRMKPPSAESAAVAVVVVTLAEAEAATAVTL